MKKLQLVLIGLSSVALSACGDYKSLTLAEFFNKPIAEQKEIAAYLEKELPINDLVSLSAKAFDCSKLSGRSEYPKFCNLTIGEFIEKSKSQGN